jgi:hypothetical protein
MKRDQRTIRYPTWSDASRGWKNSCVATVTYVLEDDPEAVEQIGQILRLIQECPGASQRGICKYVQKHFGISRSRALGILKREMGVLWRTTGGAFNAKPCYERDRNTSGTELEKPPSSCT